MVNDLVTHIRLCITDNGNTRSASTIQPIPIKGEQVSVQTKLMNTILYNGVLINNSLPVRLRSIVNDLDIFKSELNQFLT